MHKLVYLDIDGVIADERHRAPHALSSPSRYDLYFAPEAVASDGVWLNGRLLYKWLTEQPDTTVAYLTGRQERLRTTTQAWLDANGFEGELVMKPNFVSGQLAQFKAEIMERDSLYWDLVTVYDDDRRVIDAVDALNDPSIKAVHCTWHIKPRRMMQTAKA